MVPCHLGTLCRLLTRVLPTQVLYSLSDLMKTNPHSRETKMHIYIGFCIITSQGPQTLWTTDIKQSEIASETNPLHSLARALHSPKHLCALSTLFLLILVRKITNPELCWLTGQCFLCYLFLNRKKKKKKTKHYSQREKRRAL